MLFNQKLQEINATLVNYTQEIEELQARLEQMREEKKALENHAQQLGSAENAAESALEQVRTALMMVRAVAPSEVATFKSAIDEIFSGSSQETLGTSTEDEETLEPSAQSLKPSTEADGGIAVTVDAEAITDEVADTPQEFLAESELKQYTTKQLKAIAEYLGITKKCKNKNEWCLAIAGIGIKK